MADSLDAAEEMRQLLRAALRCALKARQMLDAAALRLLIAAIDNAGAVPLPTLESRPHEVPRRVSAGDVSAILRGMRGQANGRPSVRSPGI